MRELFSEKATRMIARWVLLSGLFLAGCSGLLPEDQLHRLTRKERKKAAQIQAYYIQDESHPEIQKELGIVDAYSCKLLPGEPPASHEEATAKLRLQALKLGGNGVVSVHVVEQPKGESIGNCIELVILRGVAVQFSEDK